MSVRPIVLLGDPRLRLKGKPVDSFGKYLHELLDDLAHTMRDAPGVGLAAPQLGEAMQACVVEVEGQLHELVNPRIVRATGDDDDTDLLAGLPSTSKSFDPVQVQESNEMRRQVWAVSQRLPEKYRLVLTLRELQDLSYRQIARSLKMSESAVETLLYRARLRFKEEFISAEGEGALTHDEAVPLLAPYLAGKLRRTQAEAVRMHLAVCVKCARKVGRRLVRRTPAK